MESQRGGSEAEDWGHWEARGSGGAGTLRCLRPQVRWPLRDFRTREGGLGSYQRAALLALGVALCFPALLLLCTDASGIPGTRDLGLLAWDSGLPGPPARAVLRLQAASATGGRAERAMGMPEGTRGRQGACAAFWVRDSGQPCLLESSPGGPSPRPARGPGVQVGCPRDSPRAGRDRAGTALASPSSEFARLTRVGRCAGAGGAVPNCDPQVRGGGGRRSLTATWRPAAGARGPGPVVRWGQGSPGGIRDFAGFAPGRCPQAQVDC